MEHTTYNIRITGTVQGVGFRPFVYSIATSLGICGEVGNDSAGVFIIINATKRECDIFIQTLKSTLPPLANIDTIMIEEVAEKVYHDMQILESKKAEVTTALIPPDVSICQVCEHELFDPKNRRYLYPFITCTHCGVRYSIIKNLPYDRANTSMDDFKMCKTCEAEYKDPLDRRYHAQPIGCYECGPRLSMGIDEAVEMLKEGKILAVKGVGGYHLMCDGNNAEAIAKLRLRKQRPSKPFAIMIGDSKEAKKYAFISAKEEALLRSKERPIVLLKSKGKLPANVAPKLSKIGLFLPYTPLHLLLLKKLQSPLVATSANVTDEPIATTLKSIEKLEGVYDGILHHDREIVNGCDDSVVMVVGEETIMIRRARGYAPASVKLPFSLDKKVLALGANQKSTVAIGFGNEAILSPHIGDLDTIESMAYFEKNIETLKRVYDFEPDMVVHDKHPAYESSKYAKAHYESSVEVQHHYAHILAVMAEKQIEGKVLGVAFDGTGLGDDGTLWGGEFLLCDYQGYERVGHLKPFKLLGGAKAVKEPRRVALSLLFDAFGERALEMDNATIKAFSSQELKTLYLSWEKGLNAPLSSSVGRLFDGVASLLGVCHVMSYEGESGMLLEELYDENITDIYPLDYHDGSINIIEMVKMMLDEDTSVAVSKFFNTLVEMIVVISSKYDYLVVLSGGVFQNSVLLALILKRVPDVIAPNTIPPNDGGIALGQLVYRGNAS